MDTTNSIRNVTRYNVFARKGGFTPEGETQTDCERFNSRLHRFTLIFIRNSCSVFITRIKIRTLEPEFFFEDQRETNRRFPHVESQLQSVSFYALSFFRGSQKWAHTVLVSIDLVNLYFCNSRNKKLSAYYSSTTRQKSQTGAILCYTRKKAYDLIVLDA